ncbi:MAG: hypothetical protein H0T79_21315 [Deltaproteobacteria bacterium]|nr:hypothetical protein [Deltaproteobacteria bacterium]
MGHAASFVAFATLMTPITVMADVLPDPVDGAPAEPAEPAVVEPARKPGPREGSTPFPHKGQLGISARLALGLRAIATYGGEAYCGTEDRSTSSGNAPVCTGRTPMTLDFEVAYGVGRRVDLLLEFRFGLEKDFGSQPSLDNGPRLVKMSPGVRLFFSEGKRSKLFTTGQLVVDFSGYEDTAGQDRGNDIGIRNVNGLWFDFAREWGVYGFVGETATFARWINVELEVGIGIQGRYP